MRRLLVLIAFLLHACDEPSPAASCDEVVAHEIETRIAAHLERAPEADREAHRAAMVAAMTQTLVAECEAGRK